MSGLYSPSTAVTGRRDSRGRREQGEANYRSVGKKRPTNGEIKDNRNGTPANELDNSVNIYAYGVARNRLIQAAKRLKVHIYLVDQMGDADMMVTLKSYYRKRRRMISDAERRRIPVYVLRANTVSQMESFLMQALNINSDQEDENADPFESAMADAQRAIEEINAGKSNVDSPSGGLHPAPSTTPNGTTSQYRFPQLWQRAVSVCEDV